MKIGILTFQWSSNYGAALQAFALKQFIEKKGFDVQIVDYKPNYPKKRGSLSSNIKDLILKVLLIPDRPKINKQVNRFLQFREEYFDLTEEVSTIKKAHNLDCDCFICGSDQIWNPKLTGEELDPFYFAFFTEKIKIAYAASIGERIIRQDDVDKFKQFLADFTAISVRELQIVDQMQNLTKKKVSCVVDPTLLLDKQDYLKIVGVRTINEPYLLIYQNTRNNDVYSIAKFIAKKRDLKIVEVGYRRQFPSTGIDIIETAGPKEFLTLYCNADFVVTNTFHGTVFSVMFEKDFISIPLKGRESRVENLANMTGLQRRFVEGYDQEIIEQLIDSNINYVEAKSRLEPFKRKSMDFLIDVLNGVNEWKR
jgi:hypothetical protein